MQREPRTREHRLDCGASALGRLICADPAQPRTSEEEWAALVRSIASGDQRALKLLYDRTHRIVYTLSLRITGNRETAEEVALDVFHDVWRRAAAFDPAGGSVVGWIMNLARSRAIDRQRFEHRSKRSGPPGTEASAERESGEPLEGLQLRDERQRLLAALTHLTEAEQQAIATAFFSERTYAETALHLHQPVGTIKSRIRTGLEKLRHALSEGRSEA